MARTTRMGLLAAVVTFSACATAPPPKLDIERSRSAVGAARAAGAEHVPNAALLLRLAQFRLEEAGRKVERGQGTEASRLYESARLDAELAWHLTALKGERDRERRATDWLRRVEQKEE